MPKCRNDSARSYKGTEPSPKGLGWCAHGEKEGKKRKGKDGNMWVVKVIKNGSKRWFKSTTKSVSKSKSTPKSKNKKNIQIGSKLKFVLQFRYDIDDYKKNNGYIRMTNKLIKQLFNSKYFVKIINDCINQDMLVYLYKNLKYINKLVYLPTGIILIKKSDVKNVIIKGNNISINIETKIVKNNKKYYELPVSWSSSKIFDKVFYLDNEYLLQDMINIHMKAINHSISSSGGIISLIKFINKNNPYTNKDYSDFFYKNYKLI